MEPKETTTWTRPPEHQFGHALKTPSSSSSSHIIAGTITLPTVPKGRTSPRQGGAVVWKPSTVAAVTVYCHIQECGLEVL